MVLDRTKGYVETLTGPFKSSLADTQTPVCPDSRVQTGYREIEPPFQEAVQPYVVARQGQYIMLSNPAKEGQDKTHPEEGKGSQPPMLEIGNVVNIPGPVTFALWWQQVVDVIDGHQLRSNQYLLVEVTNEKQARDTWKKAVVLAAVPADDAAKTGGGIESLDPSKFTMGQRIIIRGAEISFFIPPTGMRVVKDPKTNAFVREAVTLESQQYCVLLDENGKKRYVKGPDVVFPVATENFVEEKKTGARVFKCIELNPNSGIHVMVIADYMDDAKIIKAGTEMFITGVQTPIYFPRPEHAIIRYDSENFVHFATAVPEGEGRYVLDKGEGKGKIELRLGPDMILLDPTRYVFVRRVLSSKESSLYFPGNQEVFTRNEAMAQERTASGSDFMTMTSGVTGGLISATYTSQNAARGIASACAVTADVVERHSSYTPSRSLTLDTKYQGAIPIAIWPGFAVQVCRTNGASRVEVGPKKVLLQYDETLTRLALSSGKPKTTDRLFETVYLKLAGNQVSDTVKVETTDGVTVEVRYILQVKFAGEPSLWFTVDNYTKQICDHARSLLRGAAKEKTIIEFTRNYVAIIRDAILGKKTETSARPGLNFPQNGVQIYDVEVQAAGVSDQNVARLLLDAQQDLVNGMVITIKRQQLLVTTKEMESVDRQILVEKQLTAAEVHQSKIVENLRRLELELAALKVSADVQTARLAAQLKSTETSNKITVIEDIQRSETAAIDATIAHEQQQLNLELLMAQTAAVKERMAAINADLVAAIQASTERDALVEVTERMGISAYLKNDSVGATLSALLDGTVLQDTFGKMAKALKAKDLKGVGSAEGK